MTRARGIRLLDVDPSLRAALSPELCRDAAVSLVVAAREFEPGIWERSEYGARDQLGCLVVTGLVTRTVKVPEGQSVELLGPMDLVRPWQEDAASFCESEFRLLQRTMFAELDAGFAARLCRWPPLLAEFSSRILRRSRRLAVDAAISNIVGVEQRILMLLWHLAERWGHVTSEGVVVDVALSQQLLAELAGTRRPTVSTALSTLQESGRIRSADDGSWVLLGSAPC